MLYRAVAGICATFAVMAVSPAGGTAQIRGSEAASVMQVIDGTRITLEYSRPRVQGRKLFGHQVAWGQPWTGANWATTLEVNKPIRLQGREVPAGKYSLWMVPRQDEWTVFLDPNHKLFHFQKPDSTAEQIRVRVKPVDVAHVEMLTWSFPAVQGDAATLRMQWGTTAIPLEIVVEPTRPVTLAADVRAMYVGTYELKPMQGIGWPETGTLEVFEKNGILRGRMPFPIHPGDELEFDLVPAGEHRLSPALYRDGKLFNIEQGGTFEFVVTGERATGVLMRGIEGTVFIEGKRLSN